MDDDELARAVRDGLTRRAEQAEPDPAVVGRARAAASRRRRSQVAVVGAAAAVALVVGTVVVVSTASGPDDRPDGPAAPATTAASAATTATDGATPLPTEWRTEYWRGVQVDVPADWGYGNPGLCGDVPTGEPYVGRPIGITDACLTPDPDATPTAPYVWFDVPGAGPGVEDLGGGWTRETVEVAGSQVGVASRDDVLRERILDSVRPGTLCDPEVDGVPTPRFESSFEGAGPFETGRLCAYRRGELVYGDQVAEGLYDRVQADVAAAAPSDQVCANEFSEVVVVTGVFQDPYTAATDLQLERDVVYDLTCGVVRTADDPLGTRTSGHVVTEATVPWATPAFRRLLVGPLGGGRWVYQRFIGVQG